MHLTYLPNSRRFVLRCTYEERSQPKAHRFKWDTVNRYWYTETAEAARAFAVHADAAAAEALNADRAVQVQSTAADASTLTVTLRDLAAQVAPGALLSADAPLPYSYQQAGTALMIARGSGILGDDMGLGKTVQALAFIEHRLRANPSARVLVMCPAAVVPNWCREIARWIGRPSHPLRGTKPPTLPENGIVVCPYSIVGYEAVTEVMRACEWDTLICDESHYLKTPSTNRTIAVWNQIRRHAKHVWCLTGTPIPNRTREIAHIVCALDGSFVSEASFLERYCDPKRIWTGSTYVKQYNGSTHSDELSRRLRASVLIRRMKSQVLPDLPSKRRDIVVLDAGKGSATRLSDEGVDIAQVVATLKADKLPPLEQLANLRHLEALDRCEASAEYIAGACAATNKGIVVFTHHRDVAVRIRDALATDGIAAAVVTGDDDRDTRQQAVDDFVAGSHKVFIGTIDSCGTGINGLQAASDTVIFVEASWVPGNNDQAEDRVCRIGASAEGFVRIVYLVSDGGIDAHVMGVVLDKQVKIARVLAAAPPAEVVPTYTEPSRPSPNLIAEQPSMFSKTERDAVATCLVFMGNQSPDGASIDNKVGWNKADLQFGSDLNRRVVAGMHLTDKQIAAAAGLLRKYINTQIKWASTPILSILAKVGP